ALRYLLMLVVLGITPDVRAWTCPSGVRFRDELPPRAGVVGIHAPAFGPRPNAPCGTVRFSFRTREESVDKRSKKLRNAL
ncbi:hypothetical protein ACWD4A_34135, partial [Streptomyces sp. NPDC002537]